MANFRNTVHEFTRIAVPYFRSEDRWAGRVLLFTVIALQLFQVWLNVRFNAWYNTFYTALQDKDWDTFIWQLGVFSVLAAFFIVSAVYQLYLQQWLQIRWRNWLTQRYIGRWLGQGTHYRMRLKGDQADNPDQRIADDIRDFVDNTLNIGIALLGSIVTLVSFVVILWTLSSATPLMIGSQSYQIPGYLVWAALIYAVLGTWITHLVGRPLIQLNFNQQRYEADFRFSLVRLRENAEEVTLLAGEGAEEARLRDRFGWVIRNWYDIMRRRKRLTFLTAGYSQVALIFPFIVVSPIYFFGSLTLGGLMQIVSAFGQVQSALSFFVSAYTSDRRLEGGAEPAVGLRGLDRLGRRPGPDRAAGRVPDRRRQGAAGRGACGRAAQRPGDRAARGIFDRAGRAGAGDRAVRGRQDVPVQGARRGVAVRDRLDPRAAKAPACWCCRSGLICRSAACAARWPIPGPRMPSAPDEIEDVLKAVGLGAFIDQLDETAYWADKLSGGEQQRLSIARALLQSRIGCSSTRRPPRSTRVRRRRCIAC